MKPRCIGCGERDDSDVHLLCAGYAEHGPDPLCHEFVPAPSTLRLARNRLVALVDFWRVLREEGLYGACDHLAFWFLGDRYVPHVWPLCRQPAGCGRYGHHPADRDEHEAGVPMAADIATALRAAHAGPSSVDSWRVAVRDPKHETTYTWPYRGEVS